MAVYGIIVSVLIFSHFQWEARCDFSSVEYYSKDLTFQVPASRRDEKLIIVSTPKSNAYSNHFYFNYINCDLISNECEAAQDCFNCPKSYEANKCHFRSPYNRSFPLGQVSLKTFGDYGEHVIVDWASEAVVNASSDRVSKRKVQIISMASCFVQDIPIELSGLDNGMRKIVLDPQPTTKSFDVFYIDYRTCPDSGWLRIKHSRDGKAAEEAECIFGLEKSKQKFSMDVVKGSASSDIVLDKNKDNWALYELRGRGNYASEFHRGANGNGDLFDIARLGMHGDNFGSLCWLPDIELTYSLNCTIFRVEPRYIRELSLDFHYKVRDFELKMVDFKRIYVLTSSSDESSCIYDLWIFDISGSAIDGPLKIQGPRCVFTHRLNPRPTMTQLNRDKICVSFVFERSSHRDRSSQRKQFTAMTECLLHTD